MFIIIVIIIIIKEKCLHLFRMESGLLETVDCTMEDIDRLLVIRDE